MGIRREIEEEGEGINTDVEKVTEGRVKIGKVRWKVVGVYAGKGIVGLLDNIVHQVEDREIGVKTIIIGEDFNARTGNEGEEVQGLEEEDWEGNRRQSKDKVINREGRVLVEFVEERGWSVFNENMKRNEQGEYTFTEGKENTVIDYVMGNREVREEVEKMVVGEKIDSDHHPVEVWIKGEKERRERRRKEEKRWRGV